MAVDEIINASSDLIPEIVHELGQIANWLQALGVVILLWLIFAIISLIINIKKKKTLSLIKKDIERLEKKIDKILRKR